MSESNQDNSKLDQLDYLTTREAAALLRVSYGTLKQARSDGTLFGRTAPIFLDVSGPEAQRAKIRYRRKNLIDWLEAGIERTITPPVNHHAAVA